MFIMLRGILILFRKQTVEKGEKKWLVFVLVNVGLSVVVVVFLAVVRS